VAPEAVTELRAGEKEEGGRGERVGIHSGSFDDFCNDTGGEGLRKEKKGVYT
jgi:hypothetical protein